MSKSDHTKITIKTSVNAPLKTVWQNWTQPEIIVNWNFATPEWCCPKADNDLRVGGKFSSRMEAKDGSFGFDFEGTYTDVILHQRMGYQLSDGREVLITFSEEDGRTKIIETFDPEKENPIEMQRDGWQAILNNFKNYTEKNN